MSKSHTWFGTQNDVKLIIDWLRDAGARQLNGNLLEGEWVADGRELTLHFPSIGPVEYWPDKINVPECGENSARAKSTILAAIRQREQPGQPHVDVDRSAVSGLRFPEFRDGRYWVAGHVWFPTSKLKDVFPELNRVCGRFERFLKTQPVVFDNTKGENKSAFNYQICSSGVIQKIFALPEAYELLRRGEFMVDYLTSPNSYAGFRRRLQLAGYEAFPES
jgi:hypothetical protein